MRHSAVKTTLFTLFLSLTAALQVTAGPVLRKLSISVDLKDNGDALVQEFREMSIDNEGTEVYIVIDNLAGSDIKDFTVSDEKGRTYRNIGKWDVKRSRLEKTNQCGIVTKKDGYELCWGLGMPGERVYHTSYLVTSMARSYEESDGFNWMFVTPNMSPSAQSVEIEINLPHNVSTAQEDSVKAWAFGFGGEVEVYDNQVKVYSTQALKSSNYVVVMIELAKGILHPSMNEKQTFKEVRETAKEGSDYKEPAWYQKLWNNVKADPELLFTFLFFIFIIIGTIWYSIRRKRERDKLYSTLDWYREIPVNGDLIRAKELYNPYFFTGTIKNEDLIGAMILRLIRTGTLRIENRMVMPTGLKKMLGGEGKMQDCIVITNFNEQNRLINTDSIRKLYNIMREASGDDLVLQPNELKKWMKNHEDEVMKFVQSIDKSGSMKDCKRHIDDVRKVHGLKKFLSDFTLANERHLSEVALWNDYLVYATLFGIADQVKADMMKLNPEYLKMNEITRNLTNNTVVPALCATTYGTAHSVKQAVTSRNSGGGGRSSFGGGGGFHGGGSGGGVR